MSIRIGETIISGGDTKFIAGRNIGDIFYTSRADNTLNGAVECNGATYNTADYIGSGNIGQLLADGKIPYVSLADYATAISTQGWCDKVGWDGAGNTDFRVPTLLPRRFVVKVQKPTADNDYKWYRLYNDGWIEQGGYLTIANNTTVNVTLPKSMINTNYTVTLGQYSDNNTVTYNRHAFCQSKSTTVIGLSNRRFASENTHALEVHWQVSGQSAIESEPTERAMVQIATSSTDEAFETCTGVLSDVANLKDLSNLTSAGKEVAGHMSMPSENYSDLTLGASGSTYTAPADGWVQCACSGSGAYFELTTAGASATASWVGGWARATIPIRKGQNFDVYYGGSFTKQLFRFTPTEGSNN